MHRVKGGKRVNMEIIGLILLAIGVNLIGYIISFITGFHIGKRKAESEDKE